MIYSFILTQFYFESYGYNIFNLKVYNSNLRYANASRIEINLSHLSCDVESII